MQFENKTKSGHEVSCLREYNGLLIGFVEFYDNLYPTIWHLHGYVKTTTMASCTGLSLVPKTNKRLMTMIEILEKYTDHHFNDSGSLIYSTYDGCRVVIPARDFKELGSANVTNWRQDLIIEY